MRYNDFMTTRDFETWMARVDELVEGTCGLGTDELPDLVDLAGLHEDGVTPAEAAREVLREAGWEG
jgi:hypothetical protein